jgi:vacuolar-type H+-ATPase subunit D/Vma8
VAPLSATRSALLARRQRIALAAQGRDLLKEKRAAWMVEFGRLSTGWRSRHWGAGRQRAPVR